MTETAESFEICAQFYQTVRPHVLDDALLCEQSLCIIQLNNNGLRMCKHKHGGGNSANSVPLNDINVYEVEV
jgi:hypothetical protein